MMRYVTIGVLTTFLLITLLVSCMVIKDSTVTDTNLYKETVGGTKDSGIDLNGECSQTLSTGCKKTEATNKKE